MTEITTNGAMGANSGGFVTPVMRSGWLVVHISALLAAYTALLFSLIASVLYLVQERRLKSKEGVGFLAWLPPLETMDRIASLSLLIGFPCMTLGLLAGRDEDELPALTRTVSIWGLASNPFDCWLTQRGLTTLSLRMRAACANAAALGDF